MACAAPVCSPWPARPPRPTCRPSPVWGHRLWWCRSFEKQARRPSRHQTGSTMFSGSTGSTGSTTSDPTPPSDPTSSSGRRRFGCDTTTRNISTNTWEPGQCVALVQAADSSVGLTATWTQGSAVQGNNVVAARHSYRNVRGPNGTYTNSTDGSSHAAIYLGQNAQGIQVEDQWMGQSGQHPDDLPGAALHRHPPPTTGALSMLFHTPAKALAVVGMLSFATAAHAAVECPRSSQGAPADDLQPV